MTIPADATLADIGEFGLIAELVALFPQGEHVLVGPGDDAAVLRVAHRSRGRLDRPAGGGPSLPPRLGRAREDVGHRAAAQNLSDINAMGGVAHSLTIGLAAPGELPAQWVLDFARGFADECALVGASVVGGDMSRAREVVVAVTVIGACAQAPVLRSGAEPGTGRRPRRPPGVVGRRTRGPGARLPVSARARRGLPPPRAAVRRRAGRRGRRSDGDDRRLRRAGRRRGPRRRRVRGGHRPAQRGVRGARAPARRRRRHRQRPAPADPRWRRGPLAARHLRPRHRPRRLDRGRHGGRGFGCHRRRLGVRRSPSVGRTTEDFPGRPGKSALVGASEPRQVQGTPDKSGDFGTSRPLG